MRRGLVEYQSLSVGQKDVKALIGGQRAGSGKAPRSPMSNLLESDRRRLTAATYQVDNASLTLGKPVYGEGQNQG